MIDISTESLRSDDENDIIQYQRNPQKRKQFDAQKLALQQQELMKMGAINKNLTIVMQDKILQLASQKKTQNHERKNFAEFSLCGLSVTNPFREKVIKIVVHPWFDLFILFVIIVNCVFLSLKEQDGLIINIMDYVFLVIFTIEMVLKIIALGFIMQPFSYMRDGWNVLDFIVVILGWVSLYLQGQNMSAIRVIRILRPLRTINSMPGMSGLVKTLINSLPSMFDILILFFFTLFIFGVIGVQLFRGRLINRCLHLETGVMLLDRYGSDVYCLEPGYPCPTDYECVLMENPTFGYQNYDNILYATLNMFIIITLEGWTDMMYTIRDAEQSFIFDLFFVIVVVFGAFFVLNLMIAVQFTFLSSAFDEIEQKKEKEKKQADLTTVINQKEVLVLETEESTGAVDKATTTQQDDQEEAKFEQCMKKCNKACACENIPCIAKSRASTKKLIEANKFELFITLVIILNSLVLATEHYDQPDWLTIAQEYCNYVFTVIFACEMLLKIYGLGVKDYFTDSMNLFDFVIVMVSLVELFESTTDEEASSSGFTILRVMRLLRVFKLVRTWQNLKTLLQTVVQSFSAIANLGALIFLFMFIYALLGKQFFGSEVLIEEDGTVARYGFTTTSEALVTIFIVLTGENWNEIMLLVMKQHGPISSIYFISVIIIGNFMLLNLFLAILLKYIGLNSATGFSENEQKAKEKKELKEQKKVEQEQQAANIAEDLFERNENENNNLDGKIDVDGQIKPDGQNNVMKSDSILGSGTSEKANEDQKKINQQEEAFAESLKKSRVSQNVRKKQILSSTYEIEGKSLYLFGRRNRCRQALRCFIEHPYFENMIYHLIGLNSVLMIIDEPRLTDPYTKKTILMLDHIISFIFLIECCVKIVVMGFVIGKKTYLKDAFNVLDFVIVICSLLNFLFSEILHNSVDISYMKAFRALRALRPLKLVSKNVGMKIAVNSLLKSIPGLINVLLISLLFYFTFGIIGVQMLKGRVSICSDPLFVWKHDCIDNGHEWLTPTNNYNNILWSMLTFFEVSTLEMWPDIMARAIDSYSEENHGPVFGNRPQFALLYISAIFITTFFILNLFISVIVNKFIEENQRTQGLFGFTEDQKEWVKMQRHMVQTDAKVIAVTPKNKCRKQVFRLVQSSFFDWFINVCIILNTICLAMEHYPATDTFESILESVNLAFTIIFTLEAVLKLASLGHRYYFYVKWNRLDFTIVCLSIFVFISGSSFQSFNLTVFRIFRIARLLRMVKASKGLRSMLRTLYLSIGNIANVGLLFLLVLFTFTIAGMDLFGEIDITDPDLNHLDHNANFSTFYLSLMVLIRCSTGESWNGIMHDSLLKVGFISEIFWFGFIFISFFIFLNVFVAVIYEEFETVKQNEHRNDVLSLNKTDIKHFVNTWAIFNPHGDYFMRTQCLPAFLMELPSPLGFKGMKISKQRLDKIIYCLNIRDHQGHVYFPEVMWTIFHSVIGNNDEDVQQCEQVKNNIKMMKIKWKALGRNMTINRLCGTNYYKTDMTVTKYMNGIKIMRVLKAGVEEKRRQRKLNGDKPDHNQKKSVNLLDVNVIRERNKQIQKDALNLSNMQQKNNNLSFDAREQNQGLSKSFDFAKGQQNQLNIELANSPDKELSHRDREGQQIDTNRKLIDDNNQK